MIADVVVVGAGPAGCAAAYDLAVDGIRVLVLDRAAFPRAKACAGGVTVKTAHALRYTILPVVRHTACHLSVSCRTRRPRRLAGGGPICHMVDRSAFDRYCLEQTMAAGAEVARVNRIDAVEERRDGVVLRTDGNAVHCRFVIGADGVHSRVRRLTRRFMGIRKGFAVKGELAADGAAGIPDMTFDFNRVPGGYAWMFPKHDHIDVGLYTHWPGVRLTRRDLVDYVAGAVGAGRPTKIAGGALGMGGWRYRPGSGRVLLAGDAAGLVDPLLGEGLYNAVVSGRQAAGAVGKALDDGSDACRSYAKALAPLQRDLLFSRTAAALFYRLPQAGHLLLTSVAAGPLAKGFALGMPLLDIFVNGHRFWLGMPIPAPTRRNTF